MQKKVKIELFTADKNREHEAKAKMEFNLEKYISVSEDLIPFREPLLDPHSQRSYFFSLFLFFLSTTSFFHFPLFSLLLLFNSLSLYFPPLPSLSLFNTAVLVNY